MKYIKLTMILFAAFLFLGSCGFFGIYGSGEIVDSRYGFEDFTSVSAGWTCDITILRGDRYSVTISLDDNIMPYLEAYVEGNVLHIDLDEWNSYANLHFKATVVMPRISCLEVSGASSASVSGFDNSGAFKARVSGASHVRADFITSGFMDLEVSGASSLTVNSLLSSGDLSLECSGASRCDLRNLAAGNGRIEVSGASTVYMGINGALSGSLSGASTLYYRGNPYISSLAISGGSRLNRL